MYVSRILVVPMPIRLVDVMASGEEDKEALEAAVEEAYQEVRKMDTPEALDYGSKLATIPETEYMKDNVIRTDTVYLSLGDREEKARDPVLATVGDRIREAHALLLKQGVKCVLEWNEGNHFKDFDVRTAKAFSRVMG